MPLLIAPRCVLCRTCANYLGRHASLERRISPRACAAEHLADPARHACESYVPAHVAAAKVPKAGPRNAAR